MKKLLFLFIFLIPFSTFADAADYTKNNACRLKDGYYQKSLNVTYPGYAAMTYEFIKKWGKLVYFVRLWEDTTEAVYAYEYSCSTKKTRQIGDSVANGLYITTELEWVSDNWIVGHVFVGDGGCAWLPSMKQMLINRMTGAQKIVDFSQYTGYKTIISKYNFKNEDMGIQTFGSTNNPNIFNTQLIHQGDECGDNSGGNRIIKVVVDISKKTMKTR